MTSYPAVTVFGSFGFGNLGDELVPGCFRRLLAAAGIDVEVRAMSRFSGVPPGDVRPYPETGSGDAGLYVLSGGGIVEARTISCMNRAIDLARRTPGMHVASHAISVEPGVRFSWWQRRALARQLSIIGPVTLRDRLSAETLAALVPGHPHRVIGDIALWTEPAPMPAELAPIIPARALPVILADVWDEPGFYDWLTRDLAALARTLDSSILLLPISLDQGRDLAVHERLAARLAETAPNVDVVFPARTLPAASFTPEIVAGLLERAPLTISMRLHGCVMSYAVGTPFLGLAYHPKLRGFADTVGWSEALVPAELPDRQSPNAYGYRFSDLAIAPGALLEAAHTVLAAPDFSAAVQFRELQIEAVRQLVDQMGPI